MNNPTMTQDVIATQEVKTTQEGAWIDIPEIDVPEYARKHPPEGVDTLAVDLGQNGQLQNIVLVKKADGRYECVIGNGRLEAAKKLGWPKIRADVKEGLTESQKLLMMIAENDKREDFNPFDRALSYQRAVQASTSQKDLAARLGISEPAVANTLALLGFTPDVMAEFRRRNYSGAKLAEFVRLPDAESQLKMAEACDKGGWSSKVLRAKVIQSLAGRTEKKAKAPAEPVGDVKPIRFSWKEGKLAVKIQPVDPADLQGFLIDMELEWKRFVDLHPMPPAAKQTAPSKEEEVAQAA